MQDRLAAASQGLFASDKPIVPVRAVHLDLKGVPPTADRLVRLLRVIAAARYNAVLVEWEDAFPWTVDQAFRSPTAYTAERVARFHEEANALGIQVIPLVQCLGHMETPLSLPRYAAMREIADRTDCLNPLAGGARELVEAMVDDVLAASPGITHLHLGGDEAWGFGTHPDTARFIAEHGGGPAGKAALYMRHVEPILRRLNERNIRPLLWHDMMIDWPEDALKRLAEMADLVVWGYSGSPETTTCHYSIRCVQRFADAGVRIWGATAYKGADGHNIDVPDLAARQSNALAWAEAAGRFGFEGLIATAWSRYSTISLQVEPIDAALDALVAVGAILHDGAMPARGLAGCIDLLDALGEKERWQACRSAMQALGSVRQTAWKRVQDLHEFVALGRRTGGRKGGAQTQAKTAERFEKDLADLAAASQAARQALAGLIEPVWIEEYLRSRIDPIQEQYNWLTSSGRRAL